MKVKKICNNCSSEYWVPTWRDDKSKFCSRKCSDEARRAKPNTKCTKCGTLFHMKEYSKKRYKRNHGFFCSRDCYSKYKSIAISGENNHQYGLKGHLNASFKGHKINKRNHNLMDIREYAPEHPFADVDGRVLHHRLLVEKNHFKFNKKYFTEIDGEFYLKRNVDVHHKDGNHENNNISNLEPLTRSEHTSLHNKERIIIRDSKGRFKRIIKTK